jgi:hypothetical protein
VTDDHIVVEELQFCSVNAHRTIAQGHVGLVGLMMLLLGGEQVPVRLFHSRCKFFT